MTLVVQIAKLIHRNVWGKSRVSLSSMTASTTVMTVKKNTHNVCGSNVGTWNISNLLQRVIESITIHCSELLTSKTGHILITLPCRSWCGMFNRLNPDVIQWMPTARVAKCGLLHLLTDILERAGAFRSTERPVDVPPKCRPGALVNTGYVPAGMELLRFVLRI